MRSMTTLLDVEPSNGPAWALVLRPEIRANVCRNIEVADLVTVSTDGWPR
jgi:hypothetical protein